MKSNRAVEPREPIDPHRYNQPHNLKRLFAAGARASSLGIAVLDSQTRFQSINASLAGEMRIGPYDHAGRTSCELVGDVARPMERVHEMVLTLGHSQSLMVSGRVRDTAEFGYWLNHCFPIVDGSGRVQQLGLFVVNVTAEKASSDIFDALVTDSKSRMADAAGLLNKFDEAIKHYHRSLREAFEALGSPFSATPSKVEHFGASIKRLDEEINAMHELIYAVHAHFSIPEC